MYKLNETLKDTGYYTDEDLSKATLNVRAGLWEEVKWLEEEGYYAVIKCDRIIINKRDGVARE